MIASQSSRGWLKGTKIHRKVEVAFIGMSCNHKGRPNPLHNTSVAVGQPVSKRVLGVSDWQDEQKASP